MSKKEETRKHIMKVALKLFSEQGYYSTTTRLIAKEASINEITLFRHFGSKEKLFQETTANYVNEMELNEEISKLESNDFADSMLKIGQDYLEFCFKNKKLYKIQMRLKDDESEFTKLKLSREFVEVLKKYFSDLNDKKIIKGDPELMAVTFINSILGAFTIFLLTGNTFSEKKIEDLVDEHSKQFSSYYIL